VTSTTEQRAARHPIGVVAERTGLSQDLLRVWERRYRAVEPSRTLDGQRVYSDADVERLRLLRLATKAGRSIRQVAPLTTDELANLVRDDEAARQQLTRGAEGGVIETARKDVNRALELTRGVNEPHLESFLRRAAAGLGIPVFLDALVAPFLRRMADERESGHLTHVQERVATATIQRVLEGAIQFLGAPPHAPNLILATPIGEQNVMGSVLAAAAAAAAGWHVTNLGADLAAGDIADAAHAVDARMVVVNVVRTDGDRVVTELRSLRARLPAAVVLVAGGPGALALAPDLRGDGIHVVADLAELRAALRAALLDDER
jgi:DNA-binding transcriptional MerR regulator/methylmalonyl-CoA mutase cobalamin-binding subunit